MQIITQTHQDPPMSSAFPDQTPESIALAYAENCAERAAIGIRLLPPPVIDGDGARLISGVATLHYLTEQFGFDYVQHWLDLLRASEAH